MKNRRLFMGLVVSATLANVGCVMFDGADDFPQPCYGPDCQGGGLARYGNAKYGHNGGYIGEPVFTPTAPVIPGGAPLPQGVTEVRLTPDATPAPAGNATPQPVDVATPPAPPVPQP